MAGNMFPLFPSFWSPVWKGAWKVGEELGKQKNISVIVGEEFGKRRGAGEYLGRKLSRGVKRREAGKVG